MEIKIKNYPVFVFLGCLPEEKISGQHIIIDLVCKISGSNWQKDEICSTIDYGKIFNLIDETLENKDINLIENAVFRLGSELLLQFSEIENVWVEITKPKIPKGLAKGAQVSAREQFVR